MSDESLETKVARHDEQLKAQGREIRDLKDLAGEVFEKIDRCTDKLSDNNNSLTETNTKLEQLVLIPPTCSRRMDKHERDIRLLQIATAVIIVVLIAMGAFIGFSVAGMVPPLPLAYITTKAAIVGSLIT